MLQVLFAIKLPKGGITRTIGGKSGNFVKMNIGNCTGCLKLEKLNRIRPIIKDYTKKYKEKDYRSKTSLTRHLKRDCYDPLIEISSVVMNHI